MHDVSPNCTICFRWLFVPSFTRSSDQKSQQLSRDWVDWANNRNGQSLSFACSSPSHGCNARANIFLLSLRVLTYNQQQQVNSPCSRRMSLWHDRNLSENMHRELTIAQTPFSSQSHCLYQALMLAWKCNHYSPQCSLAQASPICLQFPSLSRSFSVARFPDHVSWYNCLWRFQYFDATSHCHCCSCGCSFIPTWK